MIKIYNCYNYYKIYNNKNRIIIIKINKWIVVEEMNQIKILYKIIIDKIKLINNLLIKIMIFHNYLIIEIIRIKIIDNNNKHNYLIFH